MSDDDPCDVTANDVERAVWCDSRAPDACHAAMRRALCRFAAEVTHENGTPEDSLRAYANTVRSFLREESSCRSRRLERELASAIARAERTELERDKALSCVRDWATFDRILNELDNAEQDRDAALAHLRTTRRRALALGADRRDWKYIAARRLGKLEQVKHGLAKVLTRAADALETEARAVPLGAAFHGGGLDDTPKFDVMMWAVRWMRARDQSHDGDDERSEKR